MKKLFIPTALATALLAMNAGAFELYQQEIYNKDGVVVTVKGTDSTIMGDEIKFEIANDSSDDIIVQYDHVCINGYMVDALGSDEVGAGKKAIGDITLLKSVMEGFDEIATIQFNVKILEPSYKTKDESDLITLTVPGMENYEQVRDDSGEVMADTDNCRVVFKGIEDSIMGKDAKIYIENKTDDVIIVQADDTSVNGYMINAMQSCELLPHSCAIDGITYPKKYLEESYIDEIEDIECSFRISGDDFHLIEKTDPISVKVK